MTRILVLLGLSRVLPLPFIMDTSAQRSTLGADPVVRFDLNRIRSAVVEEIGDGNERERVIVVDEKGARGNEGKGMYESIECRRVAVARCIEQR